MLELSFQDCGVKFFNCLQSLILLSFQGSYHGSHTGIVDKMGSSPENIDLSSTFLSS